MTPDTDVENAVTAKRKLSHIRTTLQEKVQAHRSTGFEDVHLIHRALPEINRDEVETATELFGHRLSAPVIIESMTGGTPEAAKLNAELAMVAERLQLGMGVGSQRAGIEKPELAHTYSVVREKAPTIPVFANLGCPQIAKDDAVDRVRRAIDMIRADAVFIHLNALQESVQFEGETDFRGILERIKQLAKTIDKPVLVKETGAGISRETARALDRAGVKGINVSGLGGTSWSAVEYFRAREKNYKLQMQLGKTFWDWGIPTAASIVEVARSTKMKVFASGGVRNGLHIAKALALGAHYGGLALPVLKSVNRGAGAALERLQAMIEELKNAMFLTGASNLEQLHRVPIVITGLTGEWLELRGFEPKSYANR